MKRFLIIILSICTTLAIVTVVLVNIFISEEKIRQYVIKPIEDKTKLNIEFDSFSSGIWGGIHMDLVGLSIIDTRYKKFETLLQAESFTFYMPLSFLWSGDFNIEKIFLGNANIFVEIPKAQESDSTSEERISRMQNFSRLSVILPTIQMNHVNLTVWLEEKDISVFVSELNSTSFLSLAGNNLKLKSEITIDSLSLLLADKKHYSSTDQKLSLNLLGNISDMKFTVDGSSFTTLAISGKISGSISMANSVTNALISIHGNSIQFERIVKNLNLDINKFIKEIKGNLDYKININLNNRKFLTDYSARVKAFSTIFQKNNASISHISGSIVGDLNKVAFKKIKIIAEKQELTFDGSINFAQKLSGNLDLFLNADLSKLSKFNSYFPKNFQIQSGKIKTILSVRGEFSKHKLPIIKGRADIQNIKLELKNIPETNITISTFLNFSTRKISMKSFQFKSNNYDFNASITVSDYLRLLKSTRKKTNLVAQINGKKFDLTPYMKNDTENKRNRGDKKNKGEIVNIFFGLLSKIDVDIKAKLEQLIADKIKFIQISATVKNKDQKLIFRVDDGSLYGGKIIADSKINYNKKIINTIHHFSIKDLDLNRVTNSVLSKNNTLFGKITAKGNISLSLLSADSILSKSTVGKVSFFVNNGKLVNIPMIKKLGTEIGLFNFDTLKTKKWTGNIRIKDEKVIFSKIQMKTRKIELQSKNGIFSFNGKINFPLDIILTKEGTRVYRKKSKKLIQTFIDLIKNKEGQALLKPILTGNYNSPSIKFDWSHAEKKVKISLENKTKNLLRSLFD